MDIIDNKIMTNDYLTKSNLPASDYAYIGCPHACKYCYASFMKRFTGHDEKWGEFIDIKECDKPINIKKLKGKSVFITSVTDCYNPFEEKYMITRKILEQLINADCQITISTKSKVALDITAKHVKDNIGYLDEKRYQKELWNHRPLTDFWRVGAGTEKRLGSMGIYTMGDVAHADEDLLYHMFGVDAELLIDHAWGRESTTMEDIKEYKPKSSSISSGQVLSRDYSFVECELIVKEMTDALCLDLVDKGMATQSLTLMVGYSNELGMRPAKGTVSMREMTNSYRIILPYVLELYGRIVRKDKPIRRLSVTCNGIVNEIYEQYDLFTTMQPWNVNGNCRKLLLR